MANYENQIKKEEEKITTLNNKIDAKKKEISALKKEIKKHSKNIETIKAKKLNDFLAKNNLSTDIVFDAVSNLNEKNNSDNFNGSENY